MSDLHHPFVKWWINESGWHDKATERWQDSLVCSEGRLAIETWNAAIRASYENLGGDVPAVNFEDLYFNLDGPRGK